MTVPNVDYNDLVRIRLTLGGKIGSEANLSCNCNGGTVTTGIGTVTSSGTVNWSITVG